MLEKGVLGLPLLGFGAGIIFVISVLWIIFWKGFALWISAREEKKWWFIALLILNTIGILEIVYIFAFSQTGKRFMAKLRNKKTIDLQKESKKEGCDCVSCDGCECERHKPVGSN